jgi:hypothetical protein
MRCIDCGRERVPGERGWVVVLSPREEPRLYYCPECIASIIRGCGPEDEPQP